LKVDIRVIDGTIDGCQSPVEEAGSEKEPNRNGLTWRPLFTSAHTPGTLMAVVFSGAMAVWDE
jgi:hypothetical protein